MTVTGTVLHQLILHLSSHIRYKSLNLHAKQNEAEKWHWQIFIITVEIDGGSKAEYYLREILLCRWMVERKGSGSDPLQCRLEVNRTSYMLALKNCSIVQIYGHTIVAGKMSKHVSIVKILTYSQNLKLDMET